jgi:hypothetical protein
MKIAANLSELGYRFLSAEELGSVLHVDVQKLERLHGSWDSLPRDTYLRDGGRYRARRHASFVQEGSKLTLVPHRAHWQPTDYNALHGGLERWFEPIEKDVVNAPVWTKLLTAIGSLVGEIRPVERWYIEAHQFRIDTTDGIGRPTPEGAHRDGVDFVALLMVRRQNIRGGETRVFDAHGPTGIRFTMQEPWSMLLLDDSRVIHETTPIQRDGEPSLRDTLVLTYRAAGFQSPRVAG